MIELQGDLVKKTESWDNQKLGDMEVRDGTPFLTIGIHELEGEFVTLKKPFVVLDPQQEEGAVALPHPQQCMLKSVAIPHACLAPTLTAAHCDTSTGGIPCP